MSDSKVLLYEILNDDFLTILNELKHHFKINRAYDFNSINHTDNCDYFFSNNSIIWMDDYHKGFVLFYPIECQLIFFHLGYYPCETKAKIKEMLEYSLGYTEFNISEDNLKDTVIFNTIDNYLVSLRQFNLSEFMMGYDVITGLYLKNEVYQYFNQMERIYHFTMKFCLIYKDYREKETTPNSLRSIYQKCIRDIVKEEFYGIGGKTPEESEIIYNFVERQEKEENIKDYPYPYSYWGGEEFKQKLRLYQEGIYNKLNKL